MKGYKNSTKTVYEAEPMVAYKRGGYVEKGSGEVYKSKAAMAKHEAKESPAKERSEHKAKGGAVKVPPPKAYDPVRDEPTSRPLTADQMRNMRNRMKVSPPKRAYDPVKDEPTSRAFKKGGKVLRKADGGLVSPPDPYSPLSPPPPPRSPPPGQDAAAWAEANGLPPPPPLLDRTHPDKPSIQQLRDAPAPTTPAPSGPAWWESSPENREAAYASLYADSMREQNATLDAREAVRNSRVGRGMGPVMLRAKGGAVKAPAAKAVHKHERNMHPGKPLTKMQKGGKVGC